MTSATQTTPVQPDFSRLGNSALVRNLGKMGSAQIAIRASRLLATVLLSRLLLPEDYGLAAIVLTAYELIALFTRNGISAKIVQAAPDEVMQVAETAYRMTWIVCGALVLLQAAAAYPVALFYGEPRLALPIAAMSVIYLATPVSNIQGAFQQREGRLGRIALAGAVQVVADNILTAILALCGFGLWAIILPKILVAPIWVYFLRYGHAWRPSGGPISWVGWRDIARFSRNVLGVELMTTLQANMDNMIVGYFLGLHALGLYYFAFNSGLGITLGLVTAAGVAVYPHLCEVRDDAQALRQRLVKTRKTLAKALLPVIGLQALLAPIYVPLVFGTKWNEAIPVLMVICLSAVARPFANVTSQYLKALGRPDIEFRWQLVITAVLAFALVVASQFGILAVAFAVFGVQTLFLTGFVIAVDRRFATGKLTQEAGPRILFLAMDEGRWGPARLVEPLSRQGVAVGVLTSERNALYHSGHLQFRGVLPQSKSWRRLQRSLVAAIDAFNPSLVLPADEQAVVLLQYLARRAGPQPKHHALRLIVEAAGAPEAWKASVLKHHTRLMAEAVNVPVPAGRKVTSAADAALAAQELGGSVYVKKSFAWAGSGNRLCKTPEEAADAFVALNDRVPLVKAGLRKLLGRDWYVTGTEVDVVKAVKGHSTMYTMVAWKGEMLAGHYATRTNTVSEGGPSTCVEISANDECAEYCRRMVAAMGFSGFLSFDFMWDEERHLHVLLECNPRPNQIIHLGTAMGADLCGQLAAALRGENPGMRRVAGVTRVALFPQYWLTEGAEAAAQAEHLDVPFGDPELLAFMLEVGAKRGLDRDEIEKVLLTAVPAL